MNDLLSGGDLSQPEDYWEELTGPGKKFDRTKYADEKALYQAIARGKYEADATVDSRNRENEQLRKDYLQLDAEYKAGPKLQEMIDQMLQKRLDNDRTKDQQVNDKPELDLTKVDAIFDDKFNKREQLRRENENWRTVENKLKERWGSNYPNILRQQVEELGETPEFVNNLAKRNPQLFLRTFGLDREPVKETFEAPLPNRMRNDSFAPQGGVKRTWTYYQKLKKDNPRQYLHPKTQDQMQKDAIAYGEDFNDGDFKATLAY